MDYSRATQMRSKLQSAIDAASVGSIAFSSPAFIAAGVMTSHGTIPAGATDAINIFKGNMIGQTGYVLNSITATVAKASSTVRRRSSSQLRSRQLSCPSWERAP